jgi:hypothetical protein
MLNFAFYDFESIIAPYVFLLFINRLKTLYYAVIKQNKGKGNLMGEKYRAQKKPSDTLIIHCVDHRFQEAFGEFISEELGIEVFNPVIIAGGALALSSDHFAKFGYIWDQVDFFIGDRGVKRVILINHEDCAWYEYEHPDFQPNELKELGRSDLSGAAANIRDKHPNVEIISFWAELSGESIRFKKIE